jgi:hypothetical protein
MRSYQLKPDEVEHIDSLRLVSPSQRRAIIASTALLAKRKANQTQANNVVPLRRKSDAYTDILTPK